MKKIMSPPVCNVHDKIILSTKTENNEYDKVCMQILEIKSRGFPFDVPSKKGDIIRQKRYIWPTATNHSRPSNSIPWTQVSRSRAHFKQRSSPNPDLGSSTQSCPPGWGLAPYRRAWLIQISGRPTHNLPDYAFPPAQGQAITRVTKLTSSEKNTTV